MSGEIMSSSDDKSVRLWDVNGTCKQIINHPGTIWYATQNHIGDIVTAGEDYKIRTFTRDAARVNSGDMYQEFDAEMKTAAMGGSGVDVDSLPSTDTLSSVKGNKDGEIRVFKTGTTPEAYCWKGAESKWEKIGDVIMPGGST